MNRSESDIGEFYTACLLMLFSLIFFPKESFSFNKTLIVEMIGGKYTFLEILCNAVQEKD